MTRRRAAAAVVLALLVAVGVWRRTPTRRVELETVPPSADAGVVAATPEPTPTPTRAPAQPPRHPPTPGAAAHPMKTLFRGRAVFEDGRPAVGAKVRVFAAQVESPDASGRIGSESVVGDDGRFEIVGPEQETGLCVYYGVLPGFAYAGVVTTDKDVTLTFVRGGTVTGTVYDADGKPWPDVEVRLVRCDRRGRVGKPSGGAVWKRPETAAFYTQSTRTDAAGRFRIGGAPIAEKCSVAVVEDAEGVPWRSDVAAFETSGGELVRDVHVGAHAFDGRDPFRRVEGRVADADGVVIEDAEVLYGVLDGGTYEERKTESTDNAGRFVFDLGDEFERGGRPLEIRVRRAGYVTWRGAPPKPGENLRVRLTHWDREPRPGRVLGSANDVDDRPLSGALEVMVVDEFFHARRECVFADERGAFTLEGLWPGTWRLSLEGPWLGTRWISVGAVRTDEIAIRDGDEIRVRLRMNHDASRSAAKPWTDELAKSHAEARAKYQRLWSRSEDLEKAGEPSEDAKREAEEAVFQFMELDESRRAALPRRDVVVVGVPTDGAYVVRAECDGVVRSAAAKDGVARLASLSTETWKLSLERFGVGTAPRGVDIVEGEGAQTVEFSLTK